MVQQPPMQLRQIRNFGGIQRGRRRLPLRKECGLIIALQIQPGFRIGEAFNHISDRNDLYHTLLG
jgi:hypothetical protein